MHEFRACSRRGLGLAALMAATALSGAALAADTPDLSGIWWATEYFSKIQVVGGGDLPLTAKGKAAYEKNIAGLKDGSIQDNARRLCVPDGLPRVLANPYPFEIIHGPPGQTTIIYELSHQVRAITMDKPIPEEELIAFPSYNGHSSGHFEGDTLVVETAGFNEKTFLDATGAPHSDQMKTVERIRKIGRQLEDVVTVTDPDLLTRPIAARFVYDPHPEMRMEDYVCGEPHRDISKVPGVSEARRGRAQ